MYLRNVFKFNENVYFSRPITPVVLDLNYIALKKQVITAERRVLKELGFCVHVKHPHKVNIKCTVSQQFTQCMESFEWSLQILKFCPNTNLNNFNFSIELKEVFLNVMGVLV